MSEKDKAPKIDKQNIFDTTKESVENLLSKYNHLSIEGGKIYFVNKEGMVEFLKLQKTLNAVVDNKSDRKRYGFELIAKLLNDTEPAQHYRVAIKGRHRQINKAESVQPQLQVEYSIWVNLLNKRFRDTVALHNPDDDALKVMEIDLEKDLKVAESNYNYITENFDELDVRFAGWANEKLYPMITITINGKSYEKHISILVPSILYYESAPYRSNMKVSEFIKNSNHAFGEVYYMKKEENK